MTVGELIRELEEFPLEAQVYIRSGDSSYAALMCSREVVLPSEDDSGWGE